MSLSKTGAGDRASFQPRMATTFWENKVNQQLSVVVTIRLGGCL